MNPDHWEQIKELFDAVVHLSAPEREEYLKHACEDRPTLKSEVERLLRATDAAGDFLTEPVVQPSVSLRPGDLLANRYRVKRMLGRGGMGEVYEVEDEMLHEAVALKTLRVELALSETYLRRFKREIQLARKVTHPNVCRVFEVGEHKFDLGRPPVHFFTMELLPGETLSGRIRRLKRLSKDDAFGIARQMADGLQAAHQAGIVHTDFKSGNVILCEGGAQERAVITDFGLARRDPKVANADHVETVTAVQMAGTLGYMSPEQLTGGKITAASDIYSFGIVLFEMATGGLPFDNHHPINAAVQRMGGRNLSAKSLVPGLDQRWAAAIARCLQPEPERRFASAKDLGDCFREGVWRSPVVHWSRREWIRSGAAAAVLIAAALGMWLWWTRPFQPNPAAVEWYAKGQSAMRSMTYDAASKAFEKAVEEDPNFALAHASLSRAYDEMDYSDRAAKAMLRADDAAGGTLLAAHDRVRLRAYHLMVQRDFDRAAPLFLELEARAAEREKSAAAVESGWIAQQRERTEEATRAYERATQLDSGSAAARLRLGFIQGRQGKADDAAFQNFKKAEELYTASSDYEGLLEVYWQRGNLLNRRGRPKEALATVEKGLQIATPMGKTYQSIRLELLRGVATRIAGDPKQAGEMAQRAIDAAMRENMDNLASSGLIDLGSSIFAAGNREDAEPLYLRALDVARRAKLPRSEARANLQLGSLFESRNEPGKALSFIESAVPIYRLGGYRRELIQASIVLGSIQAKRSEIEASIQTLREALKAALELGDRQTETIVRDRLASSLEAQGAFPEAVVELERAADEYGPTPQGQYARMNLARIQRLLGQGEDAKRTRDLAARFLENRSDPGLSVRVQMDRAQAAMMAGRASESLAIAQRLLPTAVALGAVWKTRVELIEATAAVAIQRSLLSRQRLDRALLAFAESHSSPELARVQLESAQSLLVAGDKRRALELATDSLEFFESHRVWEGILRGKIIAWRAAGDETLRSAARSALIKLRSIWPSPVVEHYLHRPDIERLLDGRPL